MDNLSLITQYMIMKMKNLENNYLNSKKKKGNKESMKH